MKKVFLLTVVLFVTGCGSSSPRFGASIAREKKLKKEAVRPPSDEAREEAAEDDVKVDKARVLQNVKSASRTSKPSSRTAKSSTRTTKKKPGAPAAKKDVPAEDEIALPEASSASPADTSAPVDQQRMMATIAEWLETPYSYGSDGAEAGIDCSAFTREVFEQAADITLPRSSAEQAQVGRRVLRDELKFGDLVFFRTRGRSISHVGIYLGDDLFAHASSGSGVTISSLDSTYFNKRYAAARRVLK
jgi:cell wall-associated NlpC family hydrolase